MSQPVPTEELVAEVARHGHVAYLITASPEGRPHTVSVRVEPDGDRWVAAVGSTSAGYAEAHGVATVLWPPPPDDPGYCLIVDGEATVDRDDDGPRLRLTPTRAVRHRQADADPDAPSCITVGS